jgi:hypothetical protein
VKFFLGALLLFGAAPSDAASSRSGTAAFAVALGPAAFAVAADPNSINGRLIVRRLDLGGGLLWEQRWGSGRDETPVEAAVTLSGTLVVAGDSSQGCFVTRWNGDGRLLWSTDLLVGTECHTRTLVVDSENNSYVLGTTTQDGVFAATVWKIDRHGTVEWSYRDDPDAPNYAFALLLSAKADLVTITAVRRQGAGWAYNNFALDPNGGIAPVLHY